MAIANKIHFPGLNGLRFIAASLVILQHVEVHKMFLHATNFAHTFSFIIPVGTSAVTFFFVLSGFLITYLLLKEKEVSGTVSVKKFYLRRVLRIWPLYYLLTIVGFFILPFLSYMDAGELSKGIFNRYWINAGLYFLMMPNVARLLYPLIVYVAQLWSIGVEEQFYLFWPLLMKRKNSLSAISIVFFGWVALRIIFWILNRVLSYNFFIKTMGGFLAITRFDCMAIGAMGAYILFENKTQILSFLFSKWTQFSFYLFVFMSIARPINYGMFNEEIMSVGYCMIIVNVAANPGSFITLRNKYLEYLGKISYGLYMYHWPVIGIVMALLKNYIQPGHPFMSILANFISLLATIAVASVSYKYFESWFLRKKTSYTVITSGDAVEESKHQPDIKVAV